MPDQLSQMKKRQATLYREKCNLLNSLTKVNERDKKRIGAVMKLWRPIKDELDQIAADVDNYFATGVLPEKPQKRNQNLASIKLEIKSLQSQKSTYKSRQSRAKSPAKKEEYQEKISRLEAQITDLQKEKRRLEASLVAK